MGTLKLKQIQIDDVFVIACPKSELKFDEKQELENAQNRKKEQLAVTVFSSV